MIAKNLIEILRFEIAMESNSIQSFIKHLKDNEI